MCAILILSSLCNIKLCLFHLQVKAKPGKGSQLYLEEDVFNKYQVLCSFISSVFEFDAPLPSHLVSWGSNARAKSRPVDLTVGEAK